MLPNDGYRSLSGARGIPMAFLGIGGGRKRRASRRPGKPRSKEQVLEGATAEELNKNAALRKEMVYGQLGIKQPTEVD